jgi:hypothetical protein
LAAATAGLSRSTLKLAALLHNHCPLCPLTSAAARPTADSSNHYRQLLTSLVKFVFLSFKFVNFHSNQRPPTANLQTQYNPIITFKTKQRDNFKFKQERARTYKKSTGPTRVSGTPRWDGLGSKMPMVTAAA